MIIQSGKKEGKSTQELVIKEPDWVQFFVGKLPNSSVTRHLKAHISAFNAKPFTAKCTRCKNSATRATLYAGNAGSPYFWCDECDPYSLAARSGKLTEVKTYGQALRFVDLQCEGLRTEKRHLIRKLAEGKGLPSGAGKQEAEAFLQ